MLPELKARFSICLIENQRHELLFLKRSDEASFGAGLWGFPGGHIEVDESATECATRELDEEIGAEHHLALRQIHPPVRDTFYGGHYEVHLFHFSWKSGSIKLNQEHAEFRWVDKADFASLDTVLGVDEDIYYLKVWPVEYLDPQKLPPSANSTNV